MLRPSKTVLRALLVLLLLMAAAAESLHAHDPLVAGPAAECALCAAASAIGHPPTGGLTAPPLERPFELTPPAAPGTPELAHTLCAAARGPP